jgi:hypothetical protein
MHRKWGISYFMFIELWFDVWGGPAVNAEQLVVCGYGSTLSSERNILYKNARLLVVGPVKG